MIKIEIDNGKCECNIGGDPCAVAAELVQAEKAVFDEVGKNGLMDVSAFGIVYHALLKQIADNAYEKADLMEGRKCKCNTCANEDCAFDIRRIGRGNCDFYKPPLYLYQNKCEEVVCQLEEISEKINNKEILNDLNYAKKILWNLLDGEVERN